MVVDVEVVVVVVLKVVFVVAVIVVVADARTAASVSLVVDAEIDFEVNSYFNINCVIMFELVLYNYQKLLLPASQATPPGVIDEQQKLGDPSGDVSWPPALSV